MKYLVEIYPVTRHQSAVVKLMLKVLGPNETKKAKELAKNGGIIVENLNKEAATNFANQLRELGAQVEVIEMKEDKPGELFQLRLLDAGENRLEVIKEIREITGLGLRESKELVDNLGIVAENLSREAAEKIKIKLEAVGAKVHIEQTHFPEPDPKDEKEPDSITGRVFMSNRLPASKLELKVYEKGFGGEKLFKTITTDDKGFYSLGHQEEVFPSSFEIRATDKQGKEISLTHARFKKKGKEEINLIAPAYLKTTAPEFTRLMKAVRPALGGKPLGMAKEDQERQDISYLFQETGWDARLLSMAALADKRSQQTDIPPDVLYALFRTGLPSGIEQLAQIGEAGLEKALIKAKESGIAETDIEAGKKAYKDFAIKHFRSQKITGGIASIEDFLRTSDLPADEQELFANIYFREDAQEVDLWEKAKEAGVSDQSIQNLQLQGKFSFLTLNNPDLAKKIQGNFESPKELAGLAEKGFYKSQSWKATIQEIAGGEREKLERLIPASFLGDGIEERLENYAADIARKVRTSFPTQVLSSMIEQDELVLGKSHAGHKGSVAKLLKNASKVEIGQRKTFVPGSVSFHIFVAGNKQELLQGIPPEEAESTLESAKKLTRLYQVAPTDESMQVLYDLGISSAFDVIAYSYKDWIEFYGPKFRSKKEADMIYRKSQQVTTVIYNFYGSAGQVNSTPLLPVSSPTIEQREVIKNDLIKRFPTLESLFGTLDFCECEHCRSVLSPAAYLVDILQFLDPDDETWVRNKALWKERHNGEDYPGQKAYDALIERRPDIPHIQLSCENTNIALPYIDIVNEILEFYVAKEELNPSVAYDTGEASSEDLMAEPQNIIPEAYQKLSQSVYPLSLPFDLSLERVRKFSQHFEIPFWKLLYTFRKEDTLFESTVGAPFVLNDVFIEQLGLNAGEYGLFTNPDFDSWFRLYGYAPGEDPLVEHTDPASGQRTDLLSAKTLSRRLGVSYKELVELVKTRFMNPVLEELAILRNLGISTEDVYRWKGEGDFSPLSEEEENAFLAKVAKATTNTFDAKAWLNRLWEEDTFSKVVVLFDAASGCDFEKTSLKYASGEDLSRLDWVKLNLFVRLWKRLGWKPEELDAALTSFIPSEHPLEEGNLGDKFKTALVYLSHLKQLHEQHQLGNWSLLNWTGLWGNLSQGEHSVYRRYFLTNSILREDPIFDHPLGKYLQVEEGGVFRPFSWKPNKPENIITGNVGLVNHLIAVQAALELTEEEIRLIILSETDKSIEEAALSMPVIQSLYGYKILREAIGLSVKEIISLSQLSGADPLKPLKRGTLNTLSEDNPYSQTIRFTEEAAAVKESVFSIDELDYLLRHHFDPAGPFSTDETEVLSFIRRISAEIRRIEEEQALPGDPAGFSEEFLKSRLLQALSPEVANTFISMWNGTIEYTASTSLATAEKLPDDLLPDKLNLSTFYDDTLQVQYVTYTGVPDQTSLDKLESKLSDLAALPATDPAKISSTQKDLLMALLPDIRNQALVCYEDHIFNPIFQKNPQQAFDQFFPIMDEGLSEEENLRRKAGKQQDLGEATLEYLKKKGVNETINSSVAGKFGLESSFAKFLLNQPDALAIEGNPLKETYARVRSSGVSISFIKDEANGQLLEGPLRSESAVLSAGDIPSETTLIIMEGYLECQVSEAFRFYLKGGNKEMEVKLAFPHLNEPLIEGSLSADGAELSALTSLEANQPYKFSLHIRNFNSGILQVQVQSQSLPKGNLNQLRLYPQAMVDQVWQANILLDKTVQLIEGFDLTEREIRYLSSNPAHFYQFPFRDLPVRPLDIRLAGEKERIEKAFERFLRLGTYFKYRKEISGGNTDLISLLEAAIDDQDETREKVIHQLALLSRHNKESLTSIFDYFQYSALSISEADGLSRIWEVAKLRQKLGVPLSTLAGATIVVSKTAAYEEKFSKARAFKQVVKAGYAPENWNRVAQTIFDQLRALQRDALVAFVMQKEKFDRIEQLFEFFLIDPGMEPVVKTSRIKLAISAVQTFVQRCLLNMEKKVSPFMINRSHWDWMKRYRVWEANRKIFLFPESYLEPEFRDDKTHLFQELESAILQGDTNKELVEQAFYDYLKGLQKIARLNMVAMYCEEDPVNPAGNTIHLIGKAFTQPSYYYRSYRNNMWSPWVPIPDQIEGEHLALIKWQDRLHVFWLTFLQKSKSKLGENETIESSAEKSPKKLNQDIVEVQLNWCEYFQGEWQPRETGSFENAMVADVEAEFDKNNVYVHASIEEENQSAVRIHVSGESINQAFRLVSKLTLPKSEGIEYDNPAVPPFNSVQKRKTKYFGNNTLKIHFKEVFKLVKEGNKKPKKIPKRPLEKVLLQNIDGFHLLFPNNPLIISGDSEINRLISPFFFEDDEQSVTLYGEPELHEKTIVTWEEWIILEKPPKSKYGKDDYWRGIPLEPYVPYDKDFFLFEENFRPGKIDPLIKPATDFNTLPVNDWLVNPKTVFLYEEEFIGSRGGFIASEVGGLSKGNQVNKVGQLVSVSSGSEVAAGKTLWLVENASAAQGSRVGVENMLKSAGETVQVVGQNGLVLDSAIKSVK